MPDAQTIVGTNGGITEKANGWFEVQVSIPGKNYPVKLATKKSELIDAVRAIGTGVGTFSFNETESERINPNTQKPYINRYLEGVEAGGTPAAATTAGGSAQAKEDVDWDAKDRRDFRSRAWAQTISAFAHTITFEEDGVAVFQRLKPLQEMIYKDIVRELGDGPSPTHAVQQQLVQESLVADEPPIDDDIPF